MQDQYQTCFVTWICLHFFSSGFLWSEMVPLWSENHWHSPAACDGSQSYAFIFCNYKKAASNRLVPVESYQRSHLWSDAVELHLVQQSVLYLGFTSYPFNKQHENRERVKGGLCSRHSSIHLCIRGGWESYSVLKCICHINRPFGTLPYVSVRYCQRQYNVVNTAILEIRNGGSLLDLQSALLSIYC